MMPGDVVTGRVLLMRHPETVANTEHFFSGRTDVALSPAGLSQRERGVEALVAFAPERIFCSPLSRAREMAQMAAGRLGVPCESWDELLEVDFGPLECLPSRAVRDRGIDFPWPLGLDGTSMTPEGAESLEHLRARARAAYERLVPLTGKTACVTHGGFLRMFQAVAYDVPLTRFWDVHILNAASLFYTSDGRDLALGGFNLSPEEVIELSTTPSAYDTRDVWGTGRRELA